MFLFLKDNGYDKLDNSLTGEQLDELSIRFWADVINYDIKIGKADDASSITFVIKKIL